MLLTCLMKNALIIFVRKPELGKVKTRLAADIGDDRALQVYIELLKHTHAVTCNLCCDKYVYYSESTVEDDMWENTIFRKASQKGEGLGERMMAAFSDLFKNGYTKVVIIGSDCPALSTDIIESAFQELNVYNAVIGPSADGGYYLLGLTELLSGLFYNKQWSTASVLQDTITSITSLNKSYFLLPVLADIDTAGDLLFFEKVNSNMK
jgi:uncharacterized protein